MKRNREIDKLNDLFVRYLLGKNGNENMLEDMVNAALSDFNFEEVKDLEIIDPYNLSENIDLKESITDIKAKTKDNQTVIIEIQLQGNRYFIRRSLYYWANSYSSLLNKSENYTKLSPVISINVLDFVLFNDIDDFHSCYLLKEIKHNKILTDHCMLHYIELPKFNLNNNDKEKLSSWIKFFKGENMSNLIKENNIFEEVEKRCQSFIDSDPLINAYRKKEWNEYFYKDMMNVEREEGFKEGELEGIKNEKYSIAKSLKKSGLDNKFISEHTGLTIDEINKL